MTESGTSEDARRPSTAAVACSKVILSILPVTQIAIGALYQNDCPKQHYIPVYLEVMGGYKLLLTGLSILRFINHLSSSAAFRCLTIAFLLCWFIIGNVWIYSIYEPNYNKTITDVDPYCNKTLYLFAFWTTNVTYILIGLLLCVSCCCKRHLPSDMTLPR